MALLGTLKLSHSALSLEGDMCGHCASPAGDAPEHAYLGQQRRKVTYLCTLGNVQALRLGKSVA